MRPNFGGRLRPLQEVLLAASFRMGLLSLARPAWRDGLTVLAYHRIEDHSSPAFDTFKPNVSAAPADFAAQMDFLSRRFNVVGLGDVLRWLDGHSSLPTYAALVTFDDGYRDLLTNALAALEERALPAALFVATDFVSGAGPFYWDLVAYCFHHSPHTSADLPIIGRQDWTTRRQRFRAAWRFVRAVKALPEEAKDEAVAALVRRMEVRVPEGALDGLHLTWDELRALVERGIDVGAHTQTHPILTRVPMEQARNEIVRSRRILERELQRPIHAFAYPNGRTGDFDETTRGIIREAGFAAGFSLICGPAHLSEVRADPLAIRRVFVSNSDSLPGFVAKVMGWPRLLGFGV